MPALNRKVICALDTSDLKEASEAVQRLAPFVGAFKIGHSLCLNHGLAVVDHLREFGANRIFLDLKFHDIPNTVALAVKEAAKHGVWMMTVHIAGGPGMLIAAVEEANIYSEKERPLLVGVSVLTSLDQHILTDHLGVQRSIEEHMTYLSKLGVDMGLDGVVCSSMEVKALRANLGREGIIITPGIRRPDQPTDDQIRIGTATEALKDGADYLVIGRGLMDAKDPEAALIAYGLLANAS